MLKSELLPAGIPQVLNFTIRRSAFSSLLFQLDVKKFEDWGKGMLWLSDLPVSLPGDRKSGRWNFRRLNNAEVKLFLLPGFLTSI
jgi:hypothetical protein